MQLGTHLDALSHLQIRDSGYNGWSVGEIAGAAGVARLGVETVPQVGTRGWLVDVSERRPGCGDVVGVEDMGGLEPSAGYAVLFHTGWSERWSDPDAYVAGEPGPGYAVADWLSSAGLR